MADYPVEFSMQVHGVGDVSQYWPHLSALYGASPYRVPGVERIGFMSDRDVDEVRTALRRAGGIP